MSLSVPRGLSPVLRQRVDISETPYVARGRAEAVFRDMRVVPLVQFHVLDAWQTDAVVPTVTDLIEVLRRERVSTFDRAPSDARIAFREYPDDVDKRAAKLIYDALFELDAMSQVVEVADTVVALNQVNDTDRKVDAVLYVPRAWRASPKYPDLLLAFSRSPLHRLDDKERRRQAESHAQWEMRLGTERCDWVGEKAHVAFFPPAFVAADMAALRAFLTTEPTLF